MRRLLTIGLWGITLATTLAQQQLPMRLWYDKPAQFFEKTRSIAIWRN